MDDNVKSDLSFSVFGKIGLECKVVIGVTVSSLNW